MENSEEGNAKASTFKWLVQQLLKIKLAAIWVKLVDKFYNIYKIVCKVVKNANIEGLLLLVFHIVINVFVI